MKISLYLQVVEMVERCRAGWMQTTNGDRQENGLDFPAWYVNSTTTGLDTKSELRDGRGNVSSRLNEMISGITFTRSRGVVRR